MVKKPGIKRTFIFVLAVLILLVQQVLAASTPWDLYNQYIPGKMLVTKRHLRGMWISTVLNLDWPSTEARDLKDDSERIQKSKEELISILDRAVDMNMNAIFFQVSPQGDALYISEHVPWSRYLTGTFGKDPGFDPLEFAIDEAHRRNLEFHAWFNPYRVSMYTNTETTRSLDIPKSVFREHPDWIRTAMNRYVVDPGIPEARNWAFNRVMEVVSNYDIDGVHFDDYFYYERTAGELKDEQTYQKYNQGQFSNIQDWRRNNTYLLIREISKEINAVKPWVKFGISPGGVWGNSEDGHPEGSNTKSTYTNYDINFADTKKWVEEELIDYIAPQIYFTFANSRASYGELATWWANITKRKNVHLYIGQALYKINDDSDQYFKGANALKEFPNQMKFNVAHPDISGSILFRAKNLTDSGKQQVVSLLKNELWDTKALIPIMPWKGGAAPEKPVVGTIRTVDSGTKITWQDNDPNTCYYAVYRFGIDEKINTSSSIIAKNLIAAVRREPGNGMEFIDTQTKKPEQVKYMVTSLDRLHHESEGLVISHNQSTYFTDLGPDYHWAINAIDELHEKKIILGDGKGFFYPDEFTKRGDFILMIVRSLELDSEFEENYADVGEDAYYYNGIGIAKKLGIIHGDNRYFNPEVNITREDMMIILIRALGAAGYEFELASEDVLTHFTDEDQISSYARPAAASLVKSGLILGNGGFIAPKSFATRAELSVMLHRILK